MENWAVTAQVARNEVERRLKDLIESGTVDQIKWGGGRAGPSVIVSLTIGIPEAAEHMANIVETTADLRVHVAVIPSQ